MTKAVRGQRGRLSVSRSKTMGQTVNGSHRYTVVGFSLTKGMGAGLISHHDTFDRWGTESPNQFSVNVPSSDLGQCLKELLKSGIGSDIIFQVGDETFQAHKQILTAHSPVFKAQFFGLIGNPNVDRVVVEDVEPPVSRRKHRGRFKLEVSLLTMNGVMKTEAFNFLEAMCPSILAQVLEIVDAVDVDSDHRDSSSSPSADCREILSALAERRLGKSFSFLCFLCPLLFGEKKGFLV
ncbi:hypothetical protein OPV22_023871 [Ensete ventricosum]|uniref:BTB domain-containing protein n=1 Tax=Ensete ventricosum TaxID=4639 RepID=A0AAV8QXQ2_ENSVE|nr:hypothetical protein OPV22_023871 [Ensete ventricosum]